MKIKKMMKMMKMKMIFENACHDNDDCEEHNNEDAYYGDDD